jgi:hypothetical protein
MHDFGEINNGNRLSSKISCSGDQVQFIIATFFLFEPTFSSHVVLKHDNTLCGVLMFVKFKTFYHISAKQEDFYFKYVMGNEMVPHFIL